MVRISAVTALAVVMMASASAQDGIQVYSPAEGDSLISDRTYTIEWTGSEVGSRVAIDLYYCGDGCSEGQCGDWVTSLCPYGERGCPDSAGDYDVVIPDPMAGTSGETYQVGVKFIDDAPDTVDCSDGFLLFAANEVVTDSLAGLTVTSPEAGDMAFSGEEYTVLFDYLDAVGSSVGRFGIDLLEDDGMGGCSGAFMAALCDKPAIGCKDTQGDYDITMAYVPSGQYQILITPFGSTSIAACSGVFDVVNQDSSSTNEDFSMSFDFE